LVLLGIVAGFALARFEVLLAVVVPGAEPATCTLHHHDPHVVIVLGRNHRRFELARQLLV